MYYRLEKPVDVAIFSGDLTGIGSRTEVEDFLDWYREFPAYYRLFIAGNHDLCFDPYRGFNNGHTPEWLREELLRFEMVDGNFYLENSSVDIKGVRFWGSPITPWFHGEHWAFNKRRAEGLHGRDHEYIGHVWKDIPDDTDVVITHGPVYGKLDFTTYDQKFVGCESLSYHISKVKPLLHFCGHIHEAYGYEYDQHTHYFNGSILNLQYEVQNEPWQLEVNFDEKDVKILNHAREKQTPV